MTYTKLNVNLKSLRTTTGRIKISSKKDTTRLSRKLMSAQSNSSRTLELRLMMMTRKREKKSMKMMRLRWAKYLYFHINKLQLTRVSLLFSKRELKTRKEVHIFPLTTITLQTKLRHNRASQRRPREKDLVKT